MPTAAPLIRRLFALPRLSRIWPRPNRVLLKRALPAPGKITLITGPSGGGKSRLLKSLKNQSKSCSWIDPAAMQLPDRCVIDCMCDAISPDDTQPRIEEALELLSRVGLAEAWTYLQKPSTLSDGQRWRLILALAVAGLRRDGSPATAIIAMDEFAALLDRVTAVVVSRALRRLVDRSRTPRLSAVVVTSHDDLVNALDPDTLVTCDFGNVSVEVRRKSEV
jgi:ABC-type ATPase with predicted acetyltransferase domain